MVGNRRARNAAAEVGGVQPDRGAVLARHLVGDPAGHHVPGGELGVRVDVEHEAPAVGVDQGRALAADRLGDQEVARRGQGGGVELVELQVRHRRPGAQGGGDAVAGGDLGVRGVAVELARAAGGQDHGVARTARCRPAAVRRPRVRRPAPTSTTVVRARSGMPASATRRSSAVAIAAPVASPCTCRIRGCACAASRPEGQAAVGGGVEVDPALGELAHRGRTALAEHRRRGHVAQSGAGHQRVGDVAGRECPRSR